MELIKKEKLLFGLPITIDGFGTIYQPKMEDFLLTNFDFAKFARAFKINADLLPQSNSEIKNFDIFLFQLTSNSEENLLIEELMESLKILYKTDDVKIYIKGNEMDSIGISINDEIFINRNNYDELSNIVQIIMGEGNNVLEKETQKELSEIDAKIAKRRREFEKRKREREKDLKKSDNVTTIFDLINYIIHSNYSQFTYDSAIKLTIYQIKNTFNLYRQKENYQLMIDYKTGGFEIKDKIIHWFFSNE